MRQETTCYENIACMAAEVLFWRSHIWKHKGQTLRGSRLWHTHEGTGNYQACQVGILSALVALSLKNEIDGSFAYFVMPPILPPQYIMVLVALKKLHLRSKRLNSFDISSQNVHV